MKTYQLTDVQWNLVKPLFDPKVRRGPKARHSRRRMVEAVLWLARTGCQWRELPPRYRSWMAVWAQRRRIRGTKRTVVVDYLGLPLAARATSARPHDARAGCELLTTCFPACRA